MSYAVTLRKDFKNKLTAETKTKDILIGKEIVFKSGCYTCHSFIKGKRYDGVESLAGWGNKHLSIKQIERAIRSCKADVYCTQILTDKQVKYVAEYLNSLR
jgi:cbb3-type cytochrome oxidase cytochrome c subunit